MCGALLGQGTGMAEHAGYRFGVSSAKKNSEVGFDLELRRQREPTAVCGCQGREFERLESADRIDLVA